MRAPTSLRIEVALGASDTILDCRFNRFNPRFRAKTSLAEILYAFSPAC
jgi:hypothetical protein